MARGAFFDVVASDDIVAVVGAENEKAILALCGLARQVYVFEPNHFNFSRLEHAVRKKRNAQLFNLGAGIKEEKVMLRLPQLADRPYGSRSAQVQLTRLDVAKFGLTPTCLLLDCGGSELVALRGAEGLFASGALRTVLVKTHQVDDKNTVAEATLWLLDHDFRAEPRKADDDSLWLIAKRFRTRQKRSPKPVGG